MENPAFHLHLRADLIRLFRQPITGQQLRLLLGRSGLAFAVSRLDEEQVLILLMRHPGLRFRWERGAWGLAGWPGSRVKSWPGGGQAVRQPDPSASAGRNSQGALPGQGLPLTRIQSMIAAFKVPARRALLENLDRGDSVKRLRTVGRSFSAIRAECLSRGARQEFRASDNGEHEDACIFPDGGLVRLKHADAFSGQPTVVKEVLKKGAQGWDLDDVAYKVTDEGLLVPKSPHDVNPVLHAGEGDSDISYLVRELLMLFGHERRLEP